jgi:hypothetical protein
MGGRHCAAASLLFRRRNLLSAGHAWMPARAHGRTPCFMAGLISSGFSELMGALPNGSRAGGSSAFNGA